MTLVHAFLIGAAGALAFAGSALADMSGMVGNTIQITTPNGVVKIMLHSDGTYQTSLPDGSGSKGTWSEQDGALCYTQTDPAPPADRPNPFCAPGMSGKKVGDSWTQQGPGGSVTGSVVSGQ